MANSGHSKKKKKKKTPSAILAEGDSWQTGIGHFVSAGRCQDEACRGASLLSVCQEIGRRGGVAL